MFCVLSAEPWGLRGPQASGRRSRSWTDTSHSGGVAILDNSNTFQSGGNEIELQRKNDRICRLNTD